MRIDVRIHRAKVWLDRHGTTVGIAAGVCVLVAVVLLYFAAHQGQSDASTASSNASRIADPVLDLCASRPDIPPALCSAASQVRSDPVTPVQAPLDEARVLSLVDRELARRGIVAGSGGLPVDQLAAAVRTVLVQNPGLLRSGSLVNPGTATDAQVAEAVSTYIRANPEMVQGPQGRAGAQGEPGRNGTNGTAGSPGSPGRQGAQGVGVTSLDVRSNGFGCDLVAGLTDPATGRATTKTVPVNPALCGTTSTEPTGTPPTSPEPQPSDTPIPSSQTPTSGSVQPTSDQPLVQLPGG